MVSIEKSAVILMHLPLYVVCLFSLTAFNILSLFSVFVVLMIIYHVVVLFGQISLVSWQLPVAKWA
jgi:hypothetical protein